MLWPEPAATRDHTPTSKPKPHSGGSTASQKARDSAAQSRGAAGARAWAWAAGAAGAAGPEACAEIGVEAAAGAAADSAGKWKTALTMVCSSVGWGFKGDLSGLDGKAVCVLARILAVPDRAIHELAAAHLRLGQRGLGGGGGLLVDVQAVDGAGHAQVVGVVRSEEHTSELQSPCNLVCRLLLEKKKKKNHTQTATLN